jgi:hypothetical protein
MRREEPLTMAYVRRQTGHKMRLVRVLRQKGGLPDMVGTRPLRGRLSEVG